MSAASRKNTVYQELFSFDWQFSLGDMTPEAALRGEGEWRGVQLPHDWSIDYPYYDDPVEHGVCSYVVRGIGWYRKTFPVPAESKGKKLYLYFEGAHQDSTVYVNGKKAAERYCGYVPFEADITDLVEYGAENVVTVRANNSDQPNSRWYTGSGLYRDVWFRTLSPVHVEEGGVQMILDKLHATSCDYTVFTDIVNDSDELAYVTIRTSVFDKDQRRQYFQEGCAVEPGAVSKINQSIYIDRPRLWSPDDPYLYTLTVELFVNGELVDLYNTVFGVRTLAFDNRKGFSLNGKHTKIIGAAVHQEGGCVGAAVPKKVWERRFKKLKECGINGIRTGHNPPDEALQKVCDELGFLVLDEAFDEWKLIKETKSRGDAAILSRGYGERFDTEFEKDIISFVKRDRNHPSVVIWSSGNEIPDQTQQAGIERVKKIVELFHAYDPTRPVTLALDNMVAEPNYALEEFANQLDIVGYNYVDRWRTRAETMYDDDKLKHPEWIQMGTEHPPIFGSEQGKYSLDKDPDDFFSMPYNTLPVEASELFRYVMTHDYIVGDYVWTGVDYFGESMWPERVGAGSILDSCGYPRDSFWFYKSYLTEEPTLHLFPHWNMDVPEGKVIPVMCYTGCDTVELFVNDKSYGKKSMLFPRYGNAAEKQVPGGGMRMMAVTTANMWLDWDVAYHPGELRAVGYKDGVKVAETVVETVGAPKKIALRTDDAALAADGRDIAQIEIDIQDELGRHCPTAKIPLTAKVEGAGMLLGFDAGEGLSHEMFSTPYTRSVGGRALLIVRAGKQAGDIKVTLSGEGVEPCEITVPVR